MTGSAARFVELIVAGTPIAQGSKRSLGAGRPTVESNRELLMPYRRAVASEALEAMNRSEPFTGPVAVSVVFSFSRPLAHFGTGRNASKLKPTAPTFRASKPDLDKLLRALFDGMSGIVYRDDGQIVEVVARKEYGPPSARVRVTEVGGTPTHLPEGGHDVTEQTEREADREVEREVEVDRPSGTEVEVETEKQNERTTTHREDEQREGEQEEAPSGL